MDIFERLREVTLAAQQENDLPDFLARRIFYIVEHPQVYGRSPLLLDRLLQQLPEYDTYAQTGYLGMGVDDGDILVTLRQLEAECQPPES